MSKFTLKEGMDIKTMEFHGYIWDKKLKITFKNGKTIEPKYTPCLGWISVEDMYGNANYKLETRGDYAGSCDLEEIDIVDMIALKQALEKAIEFYMELEGIEKIEPLHKTATVCDEL